LYQFQVKEITSAKLVVGEDEELATEYKRVSNAQKLAESAASAAEALSGGDNGGGALDALSTALRILEEAATLDKTLAPALDSVRSATYVLTENERDLIRYQDTIEFSTASGAGVLASPPGAAYAAEIAHFAEACDTGRQPPLCPPRESANAIKLMLLAIEARNHQGEKIPCNI